MPITIGGIASGLDTNGIIDQLVALEQRPIQLLQLRVQRQTARLTAVTALGGNAAAVGARMALVSRACRAEGGEISESCEYVELANRLDFQQLFTEGMMFPDD